MLEVFSRMCGYFLSHNLCLRQEMSIATIERLIKGMELVTDSWLVLDELPRVSISLLLAASSQLHTLFQRTASLLGSTAGVWASSEGVAGGINVGPMVVVSSTSSVRQRSELPPSLRVMLRPIALTEPDQLHIVQVMLAAYGVHEYASMARKLSAFVTAFLNHPLLHSTHLERGLPMAVKMAGGSIKSHVTSRSTATSETLMRAAVEEVLPQLTCAEHSVVEGLFADLFPARASDLPHHTSLYPETATHHNVDSLWGPMGLKQVPLMKSVAIRLLESCCSNRYTTHTGSRHRDCCARRAHNPDKGGTHKQLTRCLWSPALGEDHSLAHHGTAARHAKRTGHRPSSACALISSRTTRRVDFAGAGAESYKLRAPVLRSRCKRLRARGCPGQYKALRSTPRAEDKEAGARNPNDFMCCPNYWVLS